MAEQRFHYHHNQGERFHTVTEEYGVRVCTCMCVHVCMWCVYVVCVCGVCMWCVYVVCVCGVCMWCVYVVRICGVCMWCVYVVCVFCMANDIHWCVSHRDT